jgi:hypothetical protein
MFLSDVGPAVLDSMVVPYHQVVDLPMVHVEVLRTVEVSEQRFYQLVALVRGKR